MEEPWRILEFYSGIGGMRYSLMRAGIQGEVLEAFDINDRANDVYKHNFGHRPFQGNIQSLSAAELDRYAADAWLLSPPCQPYTRQGLQKHSADARASSFVKILELIPQMQLPPKMLFIENVVGFEVSDTHKHMLAIFAKTCFLTQEYILSPLQFGVPYSRPRYFCLAKKAPLCFMDASLDGQLVQSHCPLLKLEDNTLMDRCLPLRNFLESSSVSVIDCQDSCDDKEVEERSEFLGKFSVPLSLIDRWGKAMDIVYPDSKRCCCFTKSYYRYIKGTGSLLSTTSKNCNQEPGNDSEICSLKEMGLRYFTPREVANLHSFPQDFCFPQNISIRQQYALLGNSLSVAVVAHLLQYLFSNPT